MCLTVVTSSHNYGHYLAEWARSIISLRTKPLACVIVDNGSTDGSTALGAAAAEMLRTAGISTQFVMLAATDFGTARNVAVAHAATEWVMHLDADDVLLPHCLDDVLPLMPNADVIALGYERFGDLAAGPRNRSRIYRDTAGPTALASSAPCSGVSPFRRAFWEQTPYRTDMIGGWDTALWIGFAHRGARFKATKRPCFLYRQHADSIFNVRRLDTRRSAIVGSKLASLRRGDHGVSVLVPWEADTDGPRQKAWNWLARHYATAHPDYEIVIGECKLPEWHKGSAVNDALGRCHGEIIVVADADCLLDPEALREAVALVAARQAPWVVPHFYVNRLDRDTSERIYRGEPWREQIGVIRQPYEGFAGGGIFVVERAAFDGCGRYPEQFRGWGAEDETIGLIMDTLIGGHVRLKYDLWHLWHPPGPRQRHPDYSYNRLLYGAIAQTVGQPETMWALLNNEPVPLLQRVRMVALVDQRRNGTVIKAGQTFMASSEEAQREARRTIPIAMPTPQQPVLDVEMARGQYRRQRLRQVAKPLQQSSFESARLAAAGKRRKAG